MAMFAKRLVKATVVATYEEAEKIEAKLESLNKYPMEPETKTFSCKNPLLLTRPKDERSNELEGVVKMVQKLSNKIADMEKERESKKQFKPYYRRKDESGSSQPPTHSPSIMNLIEVGMDNLCTFHQQPHSEKNCLQWINSMTLVMNQLLDSKLTNLEVEDEKVHESGEAPEETTMVLWDCAPMMDLEDEDLLDEE